MKSNAEYLTQYGYQRYVFLPALLLSLSLSLSLDFALFLLLRLPVSNGN
jgi:hypothetical protein